MMLKLCKIFIISFASIMMLWGVWAIIILLASENYQQQYQQPMGALWFAVHADSLNLLQAIIQRYINADLWQLLFINLLLLPIWLNATIMIVLAISCYILSFYIGGKKRKRLFI